MTCSREALKLDVKMVLLSVVVCSALLAFAAGTQVKQCPGKSFQDLSESVQLSPCTKPPCKLTKNTNQHITIKFTPEADLPELKNHVTAELFGVPLPFIGVDGNSVCDKIETDAGEKATCPLKAGTKYVYKDSFPVQSFYPTIQRLKVHWALQERGKDVICFEVPAQIV